MDHEFPGGQAEHKASWFWVEKFTTLCRFLGRKSQPSERRTGRAESESQCSLVKWTVAAKVKTISRPSCVLLNSRTNQLGPSLCTSQEALEGTARRDTYPASAAWTLPLPFQEHWWLCRHRFLRLQGKRSATTGIHWKARKYCHSEVLLSSPKLP